MIDNRPVIPFHKRYKWTQEKNATARYLIAALLTTLQHYKIKRHGDFDVEIIGETRPGEDPENWTTVCGGIMIPLVRVARPKDMEEED